VSWAYVVFGVVVYFFLQGASLENFLYFGDAFTGTKTIALTENYRSGQTILDAAHSLIKVDEGPAKELRVPLTAKAVEHAVVELRGFTHQAVEDSWVVERVQELITEGAREEGIIIILRTNREVEAYAGALRKAGIPAHASADGDILGHPITNAVRTLIDAVVRPGSNETLFRVLHGSYWGIPANDLVRIVSARSFNQSLAQIIESRDILESLGVEHIDNVLRVPEVINEARKQESVEAPHRVLEYLLNEDQAGAARILEENQTTLRIGNAQPALGRLAALRRYLTYVGQQLGVSRGYLGKHPTW